MAVGTTALLAAGVGAAGSIIGGSKASSAAAKAGDAQVQATREAIEFQQGIFDQTREDNRFGLDANQRALAAVGYDLGLGDAPVFYGAIGEGGGVGAPASQNAFAILPQWGGDPASVREQINALNLEMQGKGDWFESEYQTRMAALERQLQDAGLPTSYMVGDESFATQDEARAYIAEQEAAAADAAPTEEGTTYGGWQTSPGYDFRVSEGQKGIEQSAAARGMALSGNALRGIEGFRQSLASEEYNNSINQKLAFAGLGQAGVSNTASAAAQLGATGSSALMQAGQARGSAIANQGNIWSQTFNNLGGFAGQALGGLTYGSGGGTNALYNPGSYSGAGTFQTSPFAYF